MRVISIPQIHSNLTHDLIYENNILSEDFICNHFEGTCKLLKKKTLVISINPSPTRFLKCNNPYSTYKIPELENTDTMHNYTSILIIRMKFGWNCTSSFWGVVQIRFVTDTLFLNTKKKHLFSRAITQSKIIQSKNKTLQQIMHKD